MVQRVMDFLGMGGYALFVWPAYGLTFIVMAGVLVQSLRRYRRAQRELEKLQRDRPHRARPGARRSTVSADATVQDPGGGVSLR